MQQLYTVSRFLVRTYPSLLVLLLSFGISFALQAQNAPPCAGAFVADPVYDDGWQDGDNAGVGYAPWELNPNVNTNESGFFIGSSTDNGDGDSNMDNDIDVVGRAWGLYANNGATAEAIRAFFDPILIDGLIGGSIDNGWVDGGAVGLALQNSSGESLMEFYFRAGEANYKTNDAAGEQDTGLGFTDEGMGWGVILTSATTYDLFVNTFEGDVLNYSGTLINPAGGQTITRVRFFNANAGGFQERNFYVGDFEVCNPGPPIACETTDASAPAFDDGWQSGDANGSGFGTWNLFSDGGNSGHFIFTSSANGDGDSNGDGDIDTGGRAFGMFANSGEVSNAVLPFTTTMSTGSTFSLDMDNGWIEAGGAVGFGLQNSSGENLAEFYFRNGEPDYKVNDAGGETGTGLNFTDEGLSISYELFANNTYSLEATLLDGGTVFNYNGTLNNPAGGQVISQVRLFNANAGFDGQRNAYFNNFEICHFPPPGCSITNIVLGEQTACDAVTNTYTQELIVSYQNEPGNSTLDVNGQSFAVTGSPQSIVLIGLDSDGLEVDVNASFSAQPDCNVSIPGLFTAPEACPPCAVTAITAGAQTACQFLTNTYTQAVTVTYENPPTTGFLEVNGEQFAITVSPQTVILAGLPSDGLSVNVVAGFTAEDCDNFADDLFTAPEGCLAEIECLGDDATGASYADGWQSGDGDSEAFGPWMLNTQNGDPATAGHFVFTSTQNGDGDSNADGDIDAGGLAWGFYANSGDFSEATRPFTEPLLPGEILGFDFDNGFVDGNAVGFGLQNANTQNLLEFIFFAGDATYSIIDANGVTPTAIPFTDEGLNVSILLVDAATYQLTITSLGDGAVYNYSGPLSAPIFGQVPNQIRFFNADAGGFQERNAYVNSLEICRRFCEAVVTDLQGECDGNGDGSISIEVLGGVPPLAFAGTIDGGVAFNGVTDDNIIELMNLTAGLYGITITDATGCVTEVEEEVLDLMTNLSCISNLNVTLGEECSLEITPGMVVAGFLGCVDEFVITVDGGNSNVITGCGDHTYELIALQNGEEIYNCWGDIFAEDKTDPVLECPDDTDVVIAADFDIQTAEGTIDATDPTIELADYSCFLSLFDPVAGPYGYDLIEFTVSASDVYNIVVDGDVADQTFISVFAGDFDPDNPCENILGGTEGAWAPGLFFGGPAIFNFFN
ncbi:MAG: hypothetical protein AAFO03_14770, partial [Bacteroidota bacterium]